MTNFTFHTIETAPTDSKPLLEKIKDGYGFTPNLFAYMAESPAILEAYLMLNELVSKTSFTPAQQQIALLTVSTENHCDFCSVAHRALAKANEANRQSMEAIHTQTIIEDPSDKALVTMVLSIVKNRGWVKDEEIEAFLRAGFTKQQVFELILIASIKTLSNYSNHLTLPEANQELLDML